MPEHNALKTDWFIAYLDCNNLGYSLCQYLPCSSFRFFKEEVVAELWLINLKGRILNPKLET